MSLDSHNSSDKNPPKKKISETPAQRRSIANATLKKNRDTAKKTYETKVNKNRTELIGDKIADVKRDGSSLLNNVGAGLGAGALLSAPVGLLVQGAREVGEFVKGKNIKQNEAEFIQKYEIKQKLKEEANLYAMLQVGNYQNALLDLLGKGFESRKDKTEAGKIIRSIAGEKLVNNISDKFEQNLALDRADISQVKGMLAEINKRQKEIHEVAKFKIDIFPNGIKITLSQADTITLNEIKTKLESRDKRLETKGQTRMEVMLDAGDYDEVIKDYIGIDGAFRENESQTNIGKKIEKSKIGNTLANIYDSIDDNIAIKNADKSQLLGLQKALKTRTYKLTHPTYKQLQKLEKLKKKVDKGLKKME